MRVRIVAMVLVAALLAASCGSRVKNDIANQPVAAPPAGNTGGQPASGGPGKFGTLDVPCGPKVSTDPNTASDKGVTENEIAITTISDPGGVKPGLNQGIFDSMEAFAEWCNGLGGINGRKVKVNLRDAQITKYKEKVAEACATDFAMVGGLGVLDSLGAQDAVDCGLVNVPGAAVSPEVTGADRTFFPLPNPPRVYAVGSANYIKSAHPGVETQAAMLYTKLSITEVQSARWIEAYTKVGYTFVDKQSSNLNESNWGPIVVNMKNLGARYMTLISSFEEIIPLQQEMARQSFKPEVTELETNFYNTKYPQQAGDIANGTLIRLPIWPFEEASKNPAMQSYLDQLKKTKADAEPEELGVQAYSAGLLWATAVKSLGGNVTRAGLIDKLRAIHSWDAGGLHGTSDPGLNKPSPCFIMMKVVAPGFAREFPLSDKDKIVFEAGNGFSCPQNATVTLTGDFGNGAKEKR